MILIGFVFASNFSGTDDVQVQTPVASLIQQLCDKTRTVVVIVDSRLNVVDLHRNIDCGRKNIRILSYNEAASTLTPME